MYITNTVSATDIASDDVFKYTIKANYRSETSNILSPKIVINFNKSIDYYLPKLSSVLKEIIVEEKSEENEVTLYFNDTRSGFDYDFIIGACFNEQRTDQETFTATAKLYINDVLIEESTANEVTLTIESYISIKTVDDALKTLKAYDTFKMTTELFQTIDFGKKEQNITFYTELSPFLKIDTSFTPTVKDISKTNKDNHLDGSVVEILEDDSNISLNIDYYAGDVLQIQYQVIVLDTINYSDVITSKNYINIDDTYTRSSTNTITISDDDLYFEILEEGPIHTYVDNKLAHKVSFSNLSDYVMNQCSLVTTIDDNLILNRFKFNPSTLIINPYSVYVNTNINENYTLIKSDVVSKLDDVIVSEFIPKDEYVKNIKIEFDILNEGLEYSVLDLEFNVEVDELTYLIDNSFTTTVNNIDKTYTSSYSIAHATFSYYYLNSQVTGDTLIENSDDKYCVEVILKPRERIVRHPVLILELPEYLELMEDELYFTYYDDYEEKLYYSYEQDFPINDIVIEVVENINDSGINIVRAKIESSTLSLTQCITMYATVKINTNYKDIYYNNTYLGGNVMFLIHNKSFKDIYDYDGDSITSGDLLYKPKAEVKILSYMSDVKLESLVSLNNINYKESVSISDDKEINYKLVVNNTKDESLKDITLINILPDSNSTYVLYDLEKTSSTLNTYLNSNISVTVLDNITNEEIYIDDYKIEYASSVDPIRFNYLDEQIGTSSFNEDIPGDLKDVKAIKITTNDDFVLSPKQSLNVYIPAVVDDNYNNGSISNNTFAIKATLVDENYNQEQLLPIESKSSVLTVDITPVDPVIIVNEDEVLLNSSFDPLANVTAYDYYNNDISSNIKVLSNDVDTLVLGSYKVVYEVSDDYGNTTTSTVVYTVVKTYTITREEAIIKLINATAAIENAIASIAYQEATKINKTI